MREKKVKGTLLETTLTPKPLKKGGWHLACSASQLKGLIVGIGIMCIGKKYHLTLFLIPRWELLATYLQTKNVSIGSFKVYKSGWWRHW